MSSWAAGTWRSFATAVPSPSRPRVRSLKSKKRASERGGRRVADTASAGSKSGVDRSRLAIAALGGVVGGLVGGFFVVGVTKILKAGMDYVSALAFPLMVVMPIVGLTVAALVLNGLGRSEGQPRSGALGWLDRWRTFPDGVVRADITGDVVDTAGEEERFPWRLAP